MMVKMQMFEFWARLIVWLGAVIFLTSTVWEIIKDSDYLITYIYWIFPIASYITGFFDMWRFRKRT
jgi:hypothetical protein